MASRLSQTDIDMDDVAKIVNLPAATATGQAVNLGQAVVFINHGATAGTARPTGAAFVIWYGSVQPTNAVVPDVVIRTDEAV